ncbi:MAG TPA: LptF/LptG family permease [Pirellulales bacterium]|jgi:lipopolysaccharide export system permease protein|nr:LptF/LptG family permease [Pirellulales bacterium]
MRLLTRYVLGEICKVFLVTLTSLTLLMILIGAVKEALAQGLGAAQIVQLLPYLLPNALIFAVPGTILFSVSSVYGRMSGANEIVALKSLGLSPMVILWPVLLFSVLLSFATVWINDLAMSWGARGVQRVVVNALEDIAYGMLRTRHSFRTPAFSVIVKQVEGRRLIGPHFSLQEESGPVTIRAKSAELASNSGSGVLTVKLYSGTIDAPGHHFEFPDREIEHDIVINPQAGRPDTSPAHMALREIPERTVRQKDLLDQIEQRMIAQAGFQMMTGDFERLTNASWNDEARQLQGERYQYFRMQTEPPRRWANGFSCLCFALVGAGMAIRMKNSDALTSFFLCFGPILLVYYPLLAFGLDRAKSGNINPYAVWMANAALAVWGLWLLRRVIRY